MGIYFRAFLYFNVYSIFGVNDVCAQRLAIENGTKKDKMIESNEVLLRLVLAVIFGGLIGIEREIVHKPAGVRTHMLVSLGSALFILLAMESIPGGIDKIMAGIITGVGFLGAGTIFKSKIEVHGLTTAASIWAVAAVGIGIGLGYYFMTIVTVVLVLIVLHLNKMEFFKNL